MWTTFLRLVVFLAAGKMFTWGEGGPVFAERRSELSDWTTRGQPCPLISYGPPSLSKPRFVTPIYIHCPHHVFLNLLDCVLSNERQCKTKWREKNYIRINFKEGVWEDVDWFSYAQGTRSLDRDQIRAGRPRFGVWVPKGTRQDRFLNILILRLLKMASWPKHVKAINI
jgi:hypothetical protein